MLRLLIGGMAAVNQVMMFLMALVFAGLGGILLGNALYWWMRARRVEGEIIGVRQDGGSFHSVFRYQIAGQSYEATSNQGSTSLRGRETGDRVPLLILPGDFTVAVEARSHVWTLVGAVSAAVGVLLFYAAVRLYPVGPMTWAAGGALAVYVGAKWYRLAQRHPRGPLPPPRAAAQPIQCVEDLMAQPERAAEAARIQGSRRRWSPVLLLAGAAILFLSYHLARNLVLLQAAGRRAPGIVQSLARGSSGAALYPVVRFVTDGGDTIRFRDAGGSNPSLYRIGDEVTVLYRASDIKTAAIDHGLWNWLVPGLVLSFGGILCAVGVRGLVKP